MNEKYRGGTILVPLKGNLSDQEVLRYAAQVAKKNGASLYAVYVVVVRQELPLESDLPDEVAFGERVLTEAANHVQEWGVDIETGILQARSAGVAIVEEAIERGVFLITMSVTYRSRLGEFNMGRTVPYVLKNAPCKVWIFRDELQKVQ
ncbi:MAG TPA: universal stress protein [Chloroflexia bacterium]|nr:universal stress protein [Chloroflexia bacterium]